MPPAPETGLAPELAAVLACPKCKGELAHRPTGVACEPCRMLFPVRRGVPVMVLAEAQPLG